MNSIVPVGECAFNLGGKVYRAFYESDPKPGCERYTLELHGRPHIEGQNKFRLEAMRGVIPANLPDSFCMAVFDASMPQSEVDCFYLYKWGPSCVLKASIQHYFADWTYPSNLHHFYRSLREPLQQRVKGCKSVTINSDDLSTSAWLEVDIDPAIDLEKSISLVSSTITMVVRESLLEIPQSASSQIQRPAELKPDERGFKWWLRHVVVPFVAVVAAAIVALMLRGLL